MKDYHIHHHVDPCGNEAMTFENIDEKCGELGIDTAAVLKHYSRSLPNGEPHWVTWHTIVPEQWERFLDEYKNFTPKKTRMFSGVETELCNQRGDINIPIAEQEKIDIIQLSVHYMIDLDFMPMDFLLYPRLELCPGFNNEEGQRLLDEWTQKCADTGVERIVEGYVEGYMNAIKRFPKIRSMAHMYDGLMPLKVYKINIDSLPIERTIEIMEPLMRLAAEKEVMWELTPAGGDERILRRANELGVCFTATADAHFLEGGWAPLTEHVKAEEQIDRYGLRRGEIRL